jgi:hypothetical protein
MQAYQRSKQQIRIIEMSKVIEKFYLSRGKRNDENCRIMCRPTEVVMCLTCTAFRVISEWMSKQNNVATRVAQFRADDL